MNESLVISVQYLEPAKPDLYKQKQPESGPQIIDSVQKFIIDKIINREVYSILGKLQEIFYEVVGLQGHNLGAMFIALPRYPQARARFQACLSLLTAFLLLSSLFITIFSVSVLFILLLSMLS